MGYYGNPYSGLLAQLVRAANYDKNFLDQDINVA